jgi:hypothetical protein
MKINKLLHDDEADYKRKRVTVKRETLKIS